MAINEPTLAELKAQLNITETTDDDLLTDILAVAVAHVESLCPDSFTSSPTPDDAPPVKQAVLMLAAHFYENREVSIYGTGQISPLPFGFEDLIAAYRAWNF